MHHPNNTPPLVLGCHHKTGSVLLIQLMDQLGPRLISKGRLNTIVSGSPIDRKAPLSGILNHYRGCGCYVNLWFEHEIDVPRDSIRLLHFVRHPVKWVRSAYLYHKKGAPSDLIRWLDWRVFRFKGESLSYCEVLNRLDVSRGLAVEAVRSFPEIIGTARVAQTSSDLMYRQQFSLEQVHDNFEATIARFCSFIGFYNSEAEKLVAELKQLDLSRSLANSLPANVTRNSPDSADLERILEQDPSFSNLFADAAQAMGFRLPPPEPKPNVCSLLPQEIVDELLAARPHLTAHWQTAERTKGFMHDKGDYRRWSTYVHQIPGCGHLMMHDFIQQLI